MARSGVSCFGKRNVLIMKRNLSAIMPCAFTSTTATTPAFIPGATWTNSAATLHHHGAVYGQAEGRRACHANPAARPATGADCPVRYWPPAASGHAWRGRRSITRKPVSRASFRSGLSLTNSAFMPSIATDVAMVSNGGHAHSVPAPAGAPMSSPRPRPAQHNPQGRQNP